MTTYEFGEIVLVDFPQTGTIARKKRPGLVILDIEDADLVLAPITTRERQGTGDLRLSSWSEAGLLRPSWVRLAKVACLEKRSISRFLGRLKADDGREVAGLWNSLYVLPTDSPPA